MKMFNLLKAANKKFLFNSFRNFSTNVPSLNVTMTNVNSIDFSKCPTLG